jgi:hypothetical protein
VHHIKVHIKRHRGLLGLKRIDGVIGRSELLGVFLLVRPHIRTGVPARNHWQNVVQGPPTFITHTTLYSRAATMRQLGAIARHHRSGAFGCVAYTD